jgi:hypothetical protein
LHYGANRIAALTFLALIVVLVTNRVKFRSNKKINYRLGRAKLVFELVLIYAAVNLSNFRNHA